MVFLIVTGILIQKLICDALKIINTFYTRNFPEYQQKYQYIAKFITQTVIDLSFNAATLLTMA